MKEIDLEDDEAVISYIKSLAPDGVEDRFRCGFIMILEFYLGRSKDDPKV